MANIQIVECNEKTAPLPADHLLMQDAENGSYLRVTRGNLIRREETLQIVIGNGSGVPGTGPAGQIYLPPGSKVELTSWRMSSVDGTSGSIQVDLWHDENRISTSDADSICGSGSEPSLTDQSENNATDLSGWVKPVLEGGCLVANIDSISNLTQVVLALDVQIIPLI